MITCTNQFSCIFIPEPVHLNIVLVQDQIFAHFELADVFNVSEQLGISSQSVLRLYSFSPFDEYLDPLDQEIEPKQNHTTNSTNDYDPLNLSDIKIIGKEDPHQGFHPNVLPNTDFSAMYHPDNQFRPVTLSTEEYVKRFSRSVSRDLFDMEKFTRFRTFMTTAPDNRPTNLRLESIAKTSGPLTVISEFNNPRVNLAIEKYLYDQMPDPSIHKSSARLTLYKNSPCVVIGKNQNPFKEINLRKAGIHSIPILRRYSGGGTVVHDLGNFNFSYTTSKQSFNRTKFSDVMNRKINQLIGLDSDLPTPNFPLGTNEKGDIINQQNQKKISGSAYHISRGKSLHHGTMLLNSDLEMLASLLKLSQKRKDCIIDKSTDSIPSSVENLHLHELLFQQCAIDAFTELHGSQNDFDLTVFDNSTILNGSQILKLNEINELPKEVFRIAKELHSWDWTFGRTPKFQFVIDEDDLKCSLTVEKGIITQVQSSTPNLNCLTNIPFNNKEISKVLDGPLRDIVAWYIDYNINYTELGLIAD
ncbi:hypothetical protein OGAPHI_007036 [Ogataea philodendri]|uniref:Putative lipoate-protein ligase A n=1 Tax=Ogataea philodendri TaxID=1378263 RepID=A0A9P8NVG9_9ASCO|nr:uncharacterized protein OGAPHI_007036 [Ogataea philodendri]KAH3660450.1 hypothetical protein OGAPHI_007036 [Ogataea philodendri]